MMEDMKSNFVPVWEFAETQGVAEQNVYRWIREGKFNPEDVEVVEKVVQRIMIRKGASIKGDKRRAHSREKDQLLGTSADNV